MKRILTGLAATAAILIALIGIPIGLYIAAGAPWPSQIPSGGDISRALTSPDDGTAFMAALKVAGWLAWASFAAMILLEIGARIRGTRVPRMPALRLQQHAAAGLVGAAALLFTTAGSLTGASVTAASAAPATPVVATVQTHAGTATSSTPTQAADAQVPVKKAPATVDYTVKAGDSLWSIAETHLGDGARFAEIAELNYGHIQSDGSQLTQNHWIQPGWTLKLPAVATPNGGDKVTVKPGDSLSEIAQDELGDAMRWPELYDATQGITQPGGVTIQNPDLILPGWTVVVPGTGSTHQDSGRPDDQDNAPSETADEDAGDNTQRGPDDAEQQHESGEGSDEATTVPGQSPTAQAAPDADQSIQSAAADVDDGAEFPVRTAAGVGALLAAGVLGLVAVRRSRQQRRRRPGQQVTMPTGQTAAVEQELRTTADPLSVETVDLALRNLAAHCGQSGQPLPRVRAGRLTADQFDLYLAEADHLPEPWQGTTDQTVWTLPVEAEELLDPQIARDVAAPYPSLVTVGHDEEDGHVFLDLEFLGALGVTGDADQTRHVLAAIAVELATSRWADDLQVTVVGSYPELEDSLETGRVRYMPAPGRLLEELQRRADVDREQLARVGMDLNHARATGQVPGAWTPEIVLLTCDVTPTQQAQLEELVDQLPRVAIAAVTHGQLVGEWAINLIGPQEATLEPIGLRIRPQLLDDATWGEILQMLATADHDLAVEPETTWHTTEPTLADIPDQSVDVDAHDEVVFPVHEDPDPNRPGDTAAREVTPDTTVAVGGDADTSPAAQSEDGLLDPHEPETTAPDVVETAAAERGQVDELTGHNPTHEQAAVDDVEFDEPEPAVWLLPRKGPQILLLGTVELQEAHGTVETSKKARLTELAAFLSLNPGCDHTSIDAAQWPGSRVSDNSRNTAMSKLRRWMGKTAEGDDFLPRYQADSGYRMHEDVTSDWAQWQQLLSEGPEVASTEQLEQALSLVRGQPFDGVRARRYAWAENLKQQMISAIIDASYELARRRLMDGRWRAAGSAAIVGLSCEPGYERLWRVRILAAHASGNPQAVQQAVERLLAFADEHGGDLEDETEELLASLNDSPPTREQLTGSL